MRIALSILIGILEIIATILKGIISTIAGYLAVIRVHLHKEYDYRSWLKRDLADCDSILELGCGPDSPILKIGYGKKTYAIDIWEPYIEMHKLKRDYQTCKKADVLDVDYGEKAFDAVVTTDVFEHLDRNKVLEIDLFKKIESCARRKVIIFCPNGYVDNDELDGDPWQRHLPPGWEPADYLKRGYTVKGATGPRWIMGKAMRPKWHPYSVWEILAMLSLPVIFNRPEWARQSYAVKELNGTN